MTTQQAIAGVVEALNGTDWAAGKVYAGDELVLVTDAGILDWVERACEVYGRAVNVLICSHYCD